MHKIALLIFVVIVCLLWADVKVEKVLETTHVKEYNQWVKRFKTEYPELKRIYVTAKLIKKTGKNESRYSIYYYDEEGKREHTEEVMGNVLIETSPYYNAVGIYTSDHPYIWPSRTIIKNSRNEIVLNTVHLYLAFISPHLYLTVPTADVSPSDPSVKVFDVNNKLWVSELKNCWLLNERDISYSCNLDFLVFSISTNSNHNSNNLICLNSQGHELWRKSFTDDPEKLGGINVAIAPDASTIIAAKDEKIYVYDSSGVLQKEYTLPYMSPAQCGLSDHGEYLWAVTRSSPKGRNIGCLIVKYNNKIGQEVWRKENILEGGPLKVVVSDDGRYGLIQFHPNVIYLIDEDGNILKQWKLETEGHHPTAPSSKKIKVVHSVRARLEFHGDLIVMIHELNGDVFAKIWRIKEK